MLRLAVCALLVAMQVDVPHAASQSDISGAARGEGHALPAKLPVIIQVDGEISSATATIGQTFPVSLAQDVRVDDMVVLPAGMSGRGEIIHAAKSGGGGRAGELIIAARYLDCGKLRVPLGKFRINEAGTNRAGAVLAASGVVSVFALFIKGGNVIVPRGTRGTASITTDIIVPTQGCGSVSGTSERPPTSNQQGE